MMVVRNCVGVGNDGGEKLCFGGSNDGGEKLCGFFVN